MLQINESEPSDGPQLSIMTYNFFYPGENVTYNSPKFQRDVILAYEIFRYNPDIACLQEVFNVNRIIRMMEEHHYSIETLQVNDHHAVAIAYKKDLFEIFYHHKVPFPSEKSCADKVHESTHGALFVCLGFKDKYLEGHVQPTRHALIIGTTHFPSRSTRSYARTKHAARLLEAVRTFTSDIRNLEKNDDLNFYTFVAGDFNSTPDDAAYLSLVSKPVKLTRWAHDMLIRADNENSKLSYVAKTPQSAQIVADLENLHNSIKKQATSLYSLGYRFVHKENTQPGNCEPWFSYWGKFCAKETLDYIFVISDWDGVTSTLNQSLEDFSKASDMKLMALLRMPTYKEMGSEDAHQPFYGEYPSDHFCMIADLELL